MSCHISLHRVRKTIQCCFFLGFIAIPFVNAKGVHAVAGNLLGMNVFGIPFADPLSMTQVVIGSLKITYEILVGAGLALLLALMLGPVFCSWICPFGFLSELAHTPGKSSGKLSGKLSGNPSDKLSGSSLGSSSGNSLGNSQGDSLGSSSGYSSGNPHGPARKKRVRLYPFMLRCSIVFLGLVAVALFIPFPLLNQLSLPGWITRFWQSLFVFPNILWAGLAFPLLIISIEFFARKRIWCRYLCPQSVFIALSGLLLPKRLRVSFTPSQCTCPASDRLCGKACSLELNPREKSLAQKAQCTNCGECIEACKSRGKALNFSILK